MESLGSVSKKAKWVLFAVLLLIATMIHARNAPAIKAGALYLAADSGSFKLMDGQGEVCIDIDGTLLLADFQGKVIPKGSLRLEFVRAGRKVYYGKGRLRLAGKFRTIQGLGQNLSVCWRGKGTCSLRRDTLKEGNGKYWYDHQKVKSDWPKSPHFDLCLPRSEK